MITCYYLKRVDILGESAKVHLYPRGREGGRVGGWVEPSAYFCAYFCTAKVIV